MFIGVSGRSSPCTVRSNISSVASSVECFFSEAILIIVILFFGMKVVVYFIKHVSLKDFRNC